MLHLNTNWNSMAHTNGFTFNIESLIFYKDKNSFIANNTEKVLT